MPSKQQLETALRNADAAGDVEAATQLANAIRSGQYEDAQPSEKPTLMQSIDSAIQSNPIGRVVSEGAAAVNRGATELADFVTTKPINAALELAGSDARIPTLTETLSPATTGNFMEAGVPRDIVRAAGEAVPGGIAVGSALRGAAGSLNPAMLSSGEGVTAGTIRQLGDSKITQDALYSGLSGAGGVVGGNVGGAFGETGRTVGTLVGSIAAPAATLGASNKIAGLADDRAQIALRLQAGDTDKDLAKFMLPPGAGKSLAPAKAIPDPEATEAIKQGFDDGVIAAIKASSPENKAKLLQQAIIAQKGKKNALYGSANRPSDIAGDSLLQRVNHIKKVNREAGSQLDGVAKSLKGKPGNFEDPVNSFIADLDSIGVRLTENNKPDFRNSDVEGVKSAENAITLIVNRMKNTKAPDAYDMHRLKRYIDEQVTYGKMGEGGLSGRVEGILKGLRRNIDTSLDNQYPMYNKVNTEYSDTVRALDDFQNTAGKKIDLFGENADKATGTVLRRLLSNAQSRINLMDSISNINDVALKYGAKFDDDIMTQVMFADQLDSVFGAAAKTSLQGDVGKAAKRALTNSTQEKALDAATIAVNKARGINEENAFKSIKKLLARDAKK